MPPFSAGRGPELLFSLWEKGAGDEG